MKNINLIAMKSMFASLAIFTLVSCTLTNKLNVTAATKGNSQAVRTNQLVEPRAQLHVSQSKWNNSRTVKVTLLYSINDATNAITGLRGALLADYTANVSNVTIEKYAFYSGRESAYIQISYKLGGTWKLENVDFWP